MNYNWINSNLIWLKWWLPQEPQTHKWNNRTEHKILQNVSQWKQNSGAALTNVLLGLLTRIGL